MLHITKHDHAQLIARARAALETPDDLDADARDQLIEDLAAAEARLEAHDLPWSLDIHVGHIEHRHGNNFYAAFSREALMAEIAEFCRECWSEIKCERDPSTVSDEEAASLYFDRHFEEYLSTGRISISGPEAAAAPPYEIELTLVLSTTHLSEATADLLDGWASETAENRPLGASDTDYGWLVQTRPIERDERAGIPDDLSAALALGRSRGCQHILFDRDASPVDQLATFDW